MSVLVVAEHDNSKIKTFTLNTINAASKIDTDVHVLVAGNKCENVCKEVAAVPLVKKVLHSDSSNYENYLAENLTPLIVKLADKYTLICYTAKAKPDRMLINGKTGTELVWEWLEEHDMAQFVTKVIAEKPRAVQYIDDKGIKFTDWVTYWEEMK